MTTPDPATPLTVDIVTDALGARLGLQWPEIRKIAAHVVERLDAARTPAPPADPEALREAAAEVVRFYGTDRTWSLMYRTLLGSRIVDLEAALAAPHAAAPAIDRERSWTSPAPARRAEIARNAELRRSAKAYLDLLDTDQGEDNSVEMLEWATAEDRLREALRAALAASPDPREETTPPTDFGQQIAAKGGLPRGLRDRIDRIERGERLPGDPT